MEYVLDSIGNAFGIRNLGLMSIVNLVYPTSVEPNTPFNISYGATNTTGVSQNGFGYIFDFGTQQQVPGSYWSVVVPAGETHPVTVSFPNGISSTFSGEVRIGHVEAGVDCIGPSGEEGGYICGNPSYPNAPLTGHRYLCTAGAWADQGEDPRCGGIPTNYLIIGGVIAAVLVVGIIIAVAKRK